MSQWDIYQLREEGLETFVEQAVSGIQHHSEDACDLMSVAQNRSRLHRVPRYH